MTMTRTITPEDLAKKSTSALTANVAWLPGLIAEAERRGNAQTAATQQKILTDSQHELRRRGYEPEQSRRRTGRNGHRPAAAGAAQTTTTATTQGGPARTVQPDPRTPAVPGTGRHLRNRHRPLVYQAEDSDREWVVKRAMTLRARGYTIRETHRHLRDEGVWADVSQLKSWGVS